MLAPEELKEIHPLGKSPVLTVSGPNSSEKPIVIAESGAIIEYLLDHFGSKLVPQRYPDGAEGQPASETEEWLRYRYYMHYSEGSLMPLMLTSLLFNRESNFESVFLELLTRSNLLELKGPAIPFFIRPISRSIATRVEDAFLTPNFSTHFAFLEQQLSTSPGNGKFLAGPNLTGADIMMEYPLEGGKTRAGLDKEKYPKIHAYLDMLHERDGYKRAIKRTEEATGKPFTLKL